MRAVACRSRLARACRGSLAERQDKQLKGRQSMAPESTARLLATALLILRSCGHTAVDDQHCLRQRQSSETCRV